MEKIIKPISGFFVLIVSRIHFFAGRAYHHQSKPGKGLYFFREIFRDHQEQRVIVCQSFFQETEDLVAGK